MIIRRLILIDVLIVLVLVIYNFNVFFGRQNKKGVEPPLVKNEQPVKTSFHENGYEDAWINDIDRKQGLVLVKTIGTKTRIVFRPAKMDIERFTRGWIAPVTFDCGQKPKEECDLSKPYKLYVSNVPVEPVEITR